MHAFNLACMRLDSGEKVQQHKMWTLSKNSTGCILFHRNNKKRGSKMNTKPLFSEGWNDPTAEMCWLKPDFLLADWHANRFKRVVLMKLSAPHEDSLSLLPWFSIVCVYVCNYKGRVIYTDIFHQQMSNLL